MKKASAMDHIGHTPKASQTGDYHMVYFVSPKTGKKVLMQGYEDPAMANSHLKEFRRLYGSLVMAGIEEYSGSPVASVAMQNYSGGRSAPYISTVKKALRKRREWLR